MTTKPTTFPGQFADVSIRDLLWTVFEKQLAPGEDVPIETIVEALQVFAENMRAYRAKQVELDRETCAALAALE